MSDEVKKINVKVEFDLDSFSILSGSEDDVTVEFSDKKLQRDILNSIRDNFIDKAENIVCELQSLLDRDACAEAYDYLLSHHFLFSKIQSNEIVKVVGKMIDGDLEVGKRIELLAIKLHFMSLFDMHNEIPVVVDRALVSFDEYLNDYFKVNLLLEKAEAYRRMGMQHTSLAIYADCISMSEDPEVKGFCYRSISKISEKNKEKNLQLAADYYFVCGKMKEQVHCLLALAEFQCKENIQNALITIDKALDIYIVTSKFLDREFYASMLHRKATFMLQMRDFKGAEEPIKESCNLRKGVMGLEGKYYAVLRLGQEVSSYLNKPERANEYKEEAEQIFQLIDDKVTLLQEEVYDFIISNKEPNEGIEKRIIDSRNPYLYKNYLIHYSKKSCSDFHEKLLVLDKALSIDTKNEMDDIVYNAIADVYIEQDRYTEALNAFNKSLSINPFNIQVYQQVCHILQSENEWGEIIKVLILAEQKLGSKPNISYKLAEAQYHVGLYAEALKRFTKVKGLADVRTEKIDDFIAACIDKLTEDELRDSLLDAKKEPAEIMISDIEGAISDFSKSISSDSRMNFWQIDKEKGGYKWVKNPEELSKQLFISFMNGRFGKGRVELIQEPRAGAGFIDLYIILSGGLKIVVELKMCGERYSSTYALSGYEQIVHYLDNKDTKVGYLIVFDSRKRDYGKNFERRSLTNGYCIITEVVDVRHNVKS